MADQAHGEYKHGSMDIREHEKTFRGFVRMTVWVVAITLAVLVFTALANG